MKSTSLYDDPRGFVCKIGDFGLSRVLEHNSTHISTNTYGVLPALRAQLSPSVAAYDEAYCGLGQQLRSRS